MEDAYRRLTNCAVLGAKSNEMAQIFEQSIIKHFSVEEVALTLCLTE